MTKMFMDKDKNRLVINYHRIGTVTERELVLAIIADLRMIQEEFGVKYCTGAKLIIHATNEYGEPITITRPTGARVWQIDTLHYRPACLDFNK